MSRCVASWEHRFGRLADHLQGLVRGQEGFTAWLDAEHTDFVRLNRGKVRQAGAVSQAELRVQWLCGKRHASSSVSLTGDADADRARLDAVVARLRDMMGAVPDDPHLRLPEEVVSTSDLHDPVLTPTDAIVEDVVRQAGNDDLVGILASGAMLRAFADHRGQRNVFSTASSHLDLSLFGTDGAAVKTGLACEAWSSERLAATLDQARRQLAVLARPPKVLDPGEVRCWLSPAALEEVMTMMCWDGFSGRAQATRQSGLQRLVDGKASFDPRVQLTEDLRGGSAPRFQGSGFVKPASVPLVVDGQHAQALVSPRTAAEYGMALNGADPGEAPTALSMAGGALDASDALEALGTGLAVSNLWYLNWSDQAAGRITGMTRFATLWVENGVPVAPVAAMRFDDTLERVLGSQLEAVGSAPVVLPSTSTYGHRSVERMTLPGVLLKGLRFTL